MTIKLQETGILQLLTAIVFCFVLPMPAGASDVPAEALKASAIIDQPVYDARGQELGEFEDLIVKRNGSVKTVLLSVGNYLEFDAKLVSVRYKSFKFSDKEIILDVEKKQLEELPEFDYRKQGLFTIYHYRIYPFGVMHGPYGPRDRELPPGYQRRWTDQGERIPKRPLQEYEEGDQLNDPPSFRHHREMRQEMRGWYDPWNWAYYPARMLASVILGQTVINKQGEEVATVEDLVIEPAGKIGKIKQLILSYGGFLDIGDRLVAVPFRSVGFTNRGITYDVTRRELESRSRYSY
jgi:sporulation protein YlmC with PRC-barrel domain